MTPWLRDADLDLYVGDVRSVLAGLPAESVDCCVTSPPYWGLRDYGTGQWDGGDPDCDHARQSSISRDSSGLGGATTTQGGTYAWKDVCGKCGARRVDQQLGLEPTPQEYVASMVAVFRQVRRVLRPHGTLWINLGDSYASGEVGRVDAPNKAPGLALTQKTRAERRIRQDTGLKPKDLCGIPWRVAFALQADGWTLRSDIVWSKPNPMPESVTDRPTKAHEMVFLLSKQPRYWFDQEAVRESVTGNAHARGDGVNPKSRVNAPGAGVKQNASFSGAVNGLVSSRNIRSVWEIATQPYAEAHFATFPEELPRRCILAGCPEWVCGTCGKARERIVERSGGTTGRSWHDHNSDLSTGQRVEQGVGNLRFKDYKRESVGWSDCGHNAYQPGVVLDPFFGSGTTGLVARKHGRRTIGIELNPDYARLAASRLQQLSLLAEAGT